MLIKCTSLAFILSRALARCIKPDHVAALVVTHTVSTF